jgi:hypothetical protein
MTQLTSKGFHVLTRDNEIQRNQAYFYLLGQMIARNCQRVWREIKSSQDGQFQGVAPRSLIRAMSNDYDSYCKPIVKHLLMSSDQEEVRLINGALMTELGTTYSRYYEYAVAKNKHLDLGEAHTETRIKARNLESVYEEKLLDCLASGRKHADLSSCYIPVGWAQWIPELGRGDVLVRRMDAPSRDGVNLAFGNVRLVFQIAPADVAKVMEKFGGFEPFLDNFIVPRLETAVRDQASLTPAANFLQLTDRCVEEARHGIKGFLQEGLHSMRLSVDVAKSVRFPLSAA